MGIGLWLARGRPIEFLAMDALQSGEQLKIQQVAKGKGDCTLPVAIDVVFLDVHLRSMPQEALQHGCHFRGRHSLELRIDANRPFFDMPVDHHPPPAIAEMPLGEKISVPGAKLLRVRGTRRGAVSPNVGSPYPRDRIND